MCIPYVYYILYLSLSLSFLLSLLFSHSIVSIPSPICPLLGFGRQHSSTLCSLLCRLGVCRSGCSTESKTEQNITYIYIYIYIFPIGYSLISIVSSWFFLLLVWEGLLAAATLRRTPVTCCERCRPWKLQQQ